MSRQQDSAVDPFITVSEQDFDPGAELARFNLPEGASPDSEIGAVASFIGIMRPTGQFQSKKQTASPLKALRLEHYPGMTERILSDMRIQAVERFQLQAARIIHRVGTDLSRRTYRLCRHRQPSSANGLFRLPISD